jgi:ParB-like chromosome segregation protein Spo0J
VDIEFHQIALRHADLRIREADRRRRLYASLAEFGQQVPVVVVRAGDGFVLIDGYLRVEALRRLGRDAVAATAWPLGEVEALLEHHHLSSAQGGSVLEEGWLAAYLHCEQGLTLEELTRCFCRSKSWVSRRLALVGGLAAEVQARVRAGVIAPQAAMKYLVPWARANGGHCRRLVAAIGDARLSVREVGALYAGYRRADAAGRERLLGDPLLYLKALAAARAQAPPGALGRGLSSDLSALAGIAWRARQRVGQGALGTDQSDGRTQLASAWRAADAAFAALASAMQEAWPDAGSDDALRDPALA